MLRFFAFLVAITIYGQGVIGQPRHYTYMMSDASLFEAGPVVDEGLAAEGLVSEAPVAEGLAADTEAPVPEGLSEAPVAIPAGSDGATFPALPLSNVLKCVKASTHLLQTKAAKGMLARSAAFFTVYLASA